ncbi:MAG: methyl-accepting chemotaxis protein [Undibacterium sp.]|nr:methyl-accepting chemotaxis protein [Undibacterium sp.]
MAKIARVSPELQQFLAAPESKVASGTAFDAHGFWTFGVVLMRNMRFTSKAMVICAMFLIPLSVLAWFYNTSMLDAINFSAKERLGVEYNREIFPVLDLAQQLRRDATAAIVFGKEPDTMAAIKEKLQAAQAKLAETDQRLGRELTTAKEFAAVQAAYAQSGAGKDVESVFKAHTVHVEALMALLAEVTDASNLTLDPDIDSYFLMDSALFRLPDIVESSGKLRGVGLSVMKSAAITPAQQRSLSELIPIAEFQGKNMRDGLAKSFASNKSLAEKINAGQTLDDTTAFFALARKSVIDSQDFSPEAQAVYLTSANKVIDGQYLLAQRLLSELDILLAKRISSTKTTLYSIDSLVLLGMLLAAYFFYSFFMVTRGGLLLISKHLQEMAEGDLRQMPAKPWGRDEPAEVIHDLRKAYDALHGLIRTVRHSARSLHATSEEIAAASLDLSGRTESAAASLEEQAAAMEEIGATVGNTAERAKLAANFAATNADVAEKGGEIIRSVVHTMQNIHASSSKINDIIGVINGIAFQTNILALNAAVEAARAGESGRGFAVVASEVRGLAQRSADAAREIKELISNSVDQIASGTIIVEKAGSTMATMVDNAKQINGYLNEISVAAKEQAEGVGQAARTIQELDESTQHNAALVEETSAASGALTQQAETLQHEIANFRVA